MDKVPSPFLYCYYGVFPDGGKMIDLKTTYLGLELKNRLSPLLQPSRRTLPVCVRWKTPGSAQLSCTPSLKRNRSGQPGIQLFYGARHGIFCRSVGLFSQLDRYNVSPDDTWSRSVKIRVCQNSNHRQPERRFQFRLDKIRQDDGAGRSGCARIEHLFHPCQP